MTVSAYNGATLLDTSTITFGAINTWTTIALDVTGITSVTIQGTGVGYHPYGIDNVVYSVSSVPEPGSLGLLLIGAAGLCWKRGVSRKK